MIHVYTLGEDNEYDLQGKVREDGDIVEGGDDSSVQLVAGDLERLTVDEILELHNGTQLLAVDMRDPSEIDADADVDADDEKSVSGGNSDAQYLFQHSPDRFDKYVEQAVRSFARKVSMIDKDVADGGNWVPYEGPEGGNGWRSTADGEVIYEDTPPGGIPDADDFTDAELESYAAEQGVEATADEIREEFEEAMDGRSSDGSDSQQDPAESPSDTDNAADDTADNADSPDVVESDAIVPPADETEPNPDEDIERFMNNEDFDESLADAKDNDFGGFTVHRNLQTEDYDFFSEEAYCTGLASVTMEPSEVEKQDITDFYERWQEVLQEYPGVRIGGFNFGGQDKFSIDLTAMITDKDEAESVAQKADQDSIFKPDTQDTIDTGGDGDDDFESPDEVKDALDGIDSLKEKARLIIKQMDEERLYENTETGEQLIQRRLAYYIMHIADSTGDTDDDSKIVDGERWVPVDTVESDQGADDQ